jgi:hypothetical protein
MRLLRCVSALNERELASFALCVREFESATPTSRMPFGGGKTDRIKPRATSCSYLSFRSPSPTIGCEWIFESLPSCHTPSMRRSLPEGHLVHPWAARSAAATTASVAQRWGWRRPGRAARARVERSPGWDAFPFEGRRCERLTDAVLARPRSRVIFREPFASSLIQSLAGRLFAGQQRRRRCV